MLDWLLIATGFTGAYTLLFFIRSLARWFRPTPVHTVHFSPKGGCTDVVIREIQSARFEIPDNRIAGADMIAVYALPWAKP